MGPSHVLENHFLSRRPLSANPRLIQRKQELLTFETSLFFRRYMDYST